MKRYFAILSIIFFIGPKSWGQQVTFSNYSSSDLPEDLKKDANAIYRLDEGTLDIISPSKYNFRTHQVITLLNSEAAHHLRQTLFYDKFEKIENVVFKIYDAFGSLVKTYQKKNFETKDYLDNISLYTDDKILFIEAAAPGYPCTIEVLSEKTVSSYIALPSWTIASPEESVEYSSFTVNVPASFDLKHRELNIDLKAEVNNSGDLKTYKWTTKNVTALKYEADSYGFYNFPRIEIAPQIFEYDGFKGELKSWQTFGAWNYPLYEEDKPFTKEDIQKIEALVSTCKTDRDKIKVLYNYLKQTTRYVSIQLGIGGFKPFPVKYVNDKKYGDCKALTNYMRYLLKTVGIKAYPALVNAGYNKMPADINFPSQRFNHVILCVPLEKDTVWLECTSNKNEPGFLGSFTEDKYALLLTEKGGVLVSTPKSTCTNNVLSTKSIISLDAEGGSYIKGNVFCTGDFWDLFYEVMQQGQDSKKNTFISYLHYKIPEKFEMNERPDSANGKQFDLTLSYEQQYEFKTGNKFFLKPRLTMLSDEDIKPVAARKFDYIFEFPYNKIDTTVYILAPGTTVDKLPLKKQIENEYASYTNEYIKNEAGTVVTIIGNLCLKKRIIPPAEYLKVADFFQVVNRSENEKFIVLKN
jgi:hypothetical protein